MRNFIEKMSPEDRKIWRKWQAGWICFYAALAMAAIGIGAFLPPASTELAQSMPTDTRAIKKPQDASAQLKQR
jgi:hypothetical protein